MLSFRNFLVSLSDPGMLLYCRVTPFPPDGRQRIGWQCGAGTTPGSSRRAPSSEALVYLVPRVGLLCLRVVDAGPHLGQEDCRGGLGMLGCSSVCPKARTCYEDMYRHCGSKGNLYIF